MIIETRLVMHKMLVRMVDPGKDDEDDEIAFEFLEEEMEVLQSGKGVESENKDGTTYYIPEAAPEEF